MPDKTSPDGETRLWPVVQKGLLGVIAAVGTATVYTLFGATIIEIATRLDFIYGVAVGTVIGILSTILLSPYWSDEIEAERPTEVTVKSSDSYSEGSKYFVIKASRAFFLLIGLMIAAGTTFAIIVGQFTFLIYFLFTAGILYRFSPRNYSELGMRDIIFDFIITLGLVCMSLLTLYGLFIYIAHTFIIQLENIPGGLSLVLLMPVTIVAFGISIVFLPLLLSPIESEQSAQ